MKLFIYPHIQPYEIKWTCPRTELILNEGFAKIPGVTLVDNGHEADFIIFHHVPQYKGQKSFELINKVDPKKLIVIDSIDENNEYFLPELNPDRYFLYFKRSMVKVDNNVRTVLPFVDRQYPWDYAILDGFYQPEQEKTIDVGCYLRDSCYYRSLILQYMYHWQSKNPKCNSVVGPVSDGSRSNNDGQVVFDKTYFDYLAKTKIIVSSGPYGWRGDSRGGEAVANKCLYMSNEFYDLMPNPPINGQHFVKFNPLNPQELFDSLAYLLYPLPECIRIKDVAEAGYIHCRDYHSSEARCRYILEKIEENNGRN